MDWNNEQLVNRFFNKVNKTESCWNWTASCNKWGYGQFKINGSIKNSHRISFEIYNKRQIKFGMYILHSCDNRKCVNPEHLLEGTHQENMTDMVKKNRQAKGESNGNTKLTKEQVVDIRKKYETGNYSHRRLGVEYNISHNQIRYIVNRENWN